MSLDAKEQAAWAERLADLEQLLADAILEVAKLEQRLIEMTEVAKVMAPARIAALEALVAEAVERVECTWWRFERRDICACSQCGFVKRAKAMLGTGKEHM